MLLFCLVSFGYNMEAIIKALVSGVCDFSDKDRKRQTGIILLLSCNRKIVNHKSTYKFTSPEYEVDLILC